MNLHVSAVWLPDRVILQHRSQHTEVWSALAVLPFHRVKVECILPFLAFSFIFFFFSDQIGLMNPLNLRAGCTGAAFSLTGTEWKQWSDEQRVGEKWWGGGKWGDRRKSFIFLTVIIELSLDLKLVLIWGRWRSNGRALPPGGTFPADAQSQHWLADDEDWELLEVSEAACAASSHCFLLGKEQFWSKVVKTERCFHGGFNKSTCVDSAFRFSSWSCIRMT